MSNRNRIYFISFYILVSGFLVVKYGIDTNSYLKMAFGASSLLFVITLLKLFNQVTSKSSSAV